MGKIKRITIYTNKIPSDMKLLIISDIHREINRGGENLKRIKDNVDMQEISTILIPGDITNSVNDLENPNFKSQLQEELIAFSQERPTFVSYGNHDLMAKDGNGHWIPGKKELLKQTIEELPNYHFISNGQKVNQENLSISACSPNYGYYEAKDKKKSERENKDDYTRIFYANYDETLFDEQTYNIFLTHEPQSIIRLSKEQGSCIQPHTDLVISGHMHNGLLPNILQPLASNRGLISPQMQLFPKYAQGIHQLGNTTFIMNGPVNTRIESSLINNIYGPNATVVTLQKKR